MINLIKGKLEKGSPENDSDKVKTPIGRIDLIDKLTKEYTQQKVSRLDSDIITAIQCDNKQARHLAVRACKVFCFWLELYTKDMFQLSFAEFFAYGVKNKFISTETCGMLKTQEQILKDFKSAGLIKSSVMIEIDNLEFFKDYDLTTNWTGTIRIETEKDKFHSIPAYNLNGEIKISDISFRGQRVNPFKYVTAQNFRYFTSIKES
jgi:hypothetical protein